MKVNIEKILDSEMDRKQFLKIVFSMLLGAVGVTRLLAGLKDLDKGVSKKSTDTYGGSSYGG